MILDGHAALVSGAIWNFNVPDFTRYIGLITAFSQKGQHQDMMIGPFGYFYALISDYEFHNVP